MENELTAALLHSKMQKCPLFDFLAHLEHFDPPPLPLRAVWETAGRRLGEGWETFERRLGNVWEGCGRRLGNVWSSARQGRRSFRFTPIPAGGLLVYTVYAADAAYMQRTQVRPDIIAERLLDSEDPELILAMLIGQGGF